MKGLKRWLPQHVYLHDESNRTRPSAETVRISVEPFSFNFLAHVEWKCSFGSFVLFGFFYKNEQKWKMWCLRQYPEILNFWVFFIDSLFLNSLAKQKSRIYWTRSYTTCIWNGLGIYGGDWWPKTQSADEIFIFAVRSTYLAFLPETEKGTEKYRSGKAFKNRLNTAETPSNSHFIPNYKCVFNFVCVPCKSIILVFQIRNFHIFSSMDSIVGFTRLEWNVPWIWLMT